jgi:hypothetical protein
VLDLNEKVMLSAAENCEFGIAAQEQDLERGQTVAHIQKIRIEEGLLLTRQKHQYQKTATA